MLSKLLLSQQENIVNKELFEIDRSIDSIVVETMQDMYIPNILEPIGYKYYKPSNDLLYTESIEEYIHKKGNRELPKTVSITKDKVLVYEFYFILHPKMADTESVVEATHIVYDVEVEPNLMVKYESKILDNIRDNYKKGSLVEASTSKTAKVNRNNRDLIFSVLLLVPQIINNKYFLLGGKKYFPTFVKNSQIVYKPKSDSVTIDYNRKLFSNMSFGKLSNRYKGNIIVEEKYHNKTNIILDRHLYAEFFNIFKDYVYLDENTGFAIAKELRFEPLANSYNVITERELEDAKTAYDINNVVRAVKSLLDKKVTDFYVLHQGLISFMKTQIYGYMKEVSHNRLGRTLHSIKTRKKIRSHILMTTIKIDSSYSLSTSVNDNDLYESIGYSKILYNKEGKVVDSRIPVRLIHKKEMETICSIKTSSSDNVGLVGCFTFSAKDIIEKDHEKIK